MALAAARGGLVLDGERRPDGSDGEISGNPAQAGDLRRKARRGGSGLGPAETPALDAKTTALLQVAVSLAIGSSAVCLQWSTARAMAAGATKDEIADVLLVIAPVAGLGRVVSAAPDMATALKYDIDAAPEEPDEH
jgi:alkylhydroperoxidase/carboxymuconolactone decarboxylase family protein YurZ